MSYQSSKIPGVGLDSATGQITSQDRFNSLKGRLPKMPAAPLKTFGGADKMSTSSITFGPQGVAHPFGSFKKGGPVKKTGVYKLHKGEYVLNEKKARMARKMKE